MSACDLCGEPFELEVLEVYGPRDFQLWTCCAGVLEEASAELERSSAFARELLEGVGVPARRCYDDELGRLRIAYGLEVGEIPQAEAKAFVREHHGHGSKPPAGWRWGHAIRDAGELVGVAFVGRAVARRLDPATVVEVTRLCLGGQAPAGLRRHASSMLYGAAVREANRRGFHRVVTYTLEEEAATSVRAAGFELEAVTKAAPRGWSRRGRSRPAGQTDGLRKLRWGRLTKAGRRAGAELPRPD